MNNYQLPNSLGPIPIYGLLIVIGFLLSILFIYIEWRKNNYSRFKFVLLVGWAGFFALFGAKWWHLIFDPSSWEGWISLVDVSGGRSILGSIFFGSVSAFIFLKIWAPEIEWRRSFSIILPNLLIGQIIGRWGNFFNQEIYGIPVESLNWLPSWISDQMLIDGQYRMPLFLYESFFNLILFFFITSFMKTNKWFKPGTHGSIYLFGYGIIRASLELFRNNDFIMKWGNFPTSFFLAILFSITGLILFIYYQWFCEEKTAVYFHFYFPLKIELLLSNFKSLFKYKTSLKESLSENKKVYNKNIKNIDPILIESFELNLRRKY